MVDEVQDRRRGTVLSVKGADLNANIIVRRQWVHGMVTFIALVYIYQPNNRTQDLPWQFEITGQLAFACGSTEPSSNNS